MSKPKHTIRLTEIFSNTPGKGPEKVGVYSKCSCGWLGASHTFDHEGDSAPPCAAIDGLRHAIQVVMAMPLMPDEYKSQFE